MIKTLLGLFTKGQSSVDAPAGNNKQKKSNPIWWILGTIAVIVVGYFVWVYIAGLKRDLQIEKQNVAWEHAKLETLQSEHGFLSEKYLKIISDNDSLVRAYEEQGKDLMILQNVNLQLHAQLESDTAIVIVDTSGGAFSGVLTSVFQNEYSDFGLTINLKDSVVFSQDLLTLRWSAINFPEFFVSMRYNMIIYRDEEGLLSGSLETFSPLLKASILETKIVDKYAAPLPLVPAPSIFAITVGGSYFYGNIGLLLRLGRWAFNPSYNLMLNTFDEDISLSMWYKMLDVRLIYFIW